MTKQATENCPSESQTSRASERIGRVGQKFGHSQIPTASFVPCQEITPRELRMTFIAFMQLVPSVCKRYVQLRDEHICAHKHARVRR